MIRDSGLLFLATLYMHANVVICKKPGVGSR